LSMVLVTGGTGFLGSSLVSELVSRGYSVETLDVIGTPTYMMDINNIGELDMKYDVVFHCAGVLGSATTFQHVYRTAHVNIMGTIALLEWAGTDTNIIQTNLIGRWSNPYMITKHTAEDIGLMYHQWRGTKYLSIRPTDIYGPGQHTDQDKATPKFIMAAIHGDPIHIYGDGTSMVNYIYVDDVARLLVDAYELGIWGEIIEIGVPGGSDTIMSFARDIIRITKSDSQIIMTDMRIGQPEASTYTPDLTLAEEYLDMSKCRSTEVGLSNTIDWYREYYG